MTDKQQEKQTQAIRDIVAATIKEVHEAQAIRFTRPATLRGWMMTVGMVAGFVAFLWSGVVFLNDVASHHEQPYHTGAEELVTAVKEAHIEHVQNTELHRREEQLQLQILRETKPINEDIQEIKQDVRSIQTKLDIIIDRNSRNH